MGRNNYRGFNIKTPLSTFSTSLGDVKDIDELYKEPDLDEKNEVTTEPEVVKYKEKEYSVKDTWSKGIVTVLSNMRKEPSLNSDVIEVLPQDTEIKVDAKKAIDGFYKIQYNNKNGYLKKDLCKVLS